MFLSLRLSKAYYFFYLVCLFFLQLLPSRGSIDIPWLFLALSVSPLYFGAPYALAGAFFWGVILGALSFQNKFFHLFIFTGGVIVVSFFSQRVNSQKALRAVCGLSVSALYTVFLFLCGEYSFVKLCATFILLNALFFIHTCALSFFIPSPEDVPLAGEEQ